MHRHLCARRYITTRFIHVALVWLLSCGGAAATELFGTVVAVADGDTLTVLDASHQQHRIRLSGIDAPEKRQAYGERAKQHLSQLVYAKPVRVVWDKRDRYGRIIGRVLAAGCDRAQCGYTIDVGVEQLKAGLAWHYRQYEKEQRPEDRARYSATEREARVLREGLWKEPDAVPPWAFRRPDRRAGIAVDPPADRPLLARNVRPGSTSSID